MTDKAQGEAPSTPVLVPRGDGSHTLRHPPKRSMRDHCSCRWLPSATGELQPTQWLDMQRRVEVALVSGEEVSGAPGGTTWLWPSSEAAAGDAPISVFIIEPDVGDPWFVPLDDVKSVTPVGEVITPADVVERVSDMVHSPQSLPEEGLQVYLIVSDHEEFEVSIKRLPGHCSPPSAQ